MRKINIQGRDIDINITGVQALILQLLNQKFGEIVSHQEIEQECSTREHLYKWDFRVHIAALRKLLLPIDYDIISYRSHGYLLCKRKFKQKIPSQKERIRAYLDSGKILTRLNAWSELGILECPARLSELRCEGYPVKTKMVTVMNRYGESVRVAEWSKE